MTITVLIADDSKLARIVAAKIVAALEPDWQRLEASSGAEALAVIGRERVDVALLDYNMPEMSGLDVAVALRARAGQMPIAIITANIQDDVLERARQLNVGFVNKPVTQEGLRGFLSGARLRLSAIAKSEAVAITLSDMERDALTELVNISVGRAATSLSQMVNKLILFSIPSVEIVTPEVAATQLREREGSDLVAVRQEFTGLFSGRALLIFPRANSLALVRAVSDPGLSPSELGELESDALSETGNVILNGCLGSIANMLERPLSLSLPELVRGDGQAMFEGQQASVILFLYVDFTVQDLSVQGYLALVMDVPSIRTLKDLVADYIDRIAR